jgi:hypothetical protein
MALNFPNSPTNGQIYLDVSTGNRWAWDSANTCWKSTSAFTQSITIAASAPGEPVVGQLWWNQDYGRLLVYYNDGTSSQWVDASPSDYTSTQAFNQSNNAYALANASYQAANASYAASNTYSPLVIPAFNKANAALANTTGVYFAGNLFFTGNVSPASSNTYDLGSSTARWRNIYTGDLHLANEYGNWTIVEGEDELFLYNNKKSKVYKFNLTEVDPATAPPKKGV